MSVKVQTPPLTDNKVLFKSLKDAQSFFSNFTVPTATKASEGSLLQGITVAYNPAPFNYNYLNTPIVNPDGSITNFIIPDKPSLDALKAEHDKLVTAVQALIASLKAAGVIASA